MKKLILILTIVCSIQMTAQQENTWLTDYKVALQQSESEDRPILVFVTDNQVTAQSELMNKEFFGSEVYKNMVSKLILLKLDSSDKQSIDYRVGSHYIKHKSGFGLALVDKSNNTIGEPLVNMTSKNIQTFIAFLNSKF